MALILNIETSASICSIALAKDGNVIGLKNGSEENDHAAQITILIDSVLKENNVILTELSAVAISAGPGSYTGLRIGTSVAKGICHALKLPLIAIDSLKAMASGIIKSGEKYDLICPLITARRMEVFTAVYDLRLNEIIPPCAMILDEKSFSSLLSQNKIVFFGSGLEQLASIVNHSNAIFNSVFNHDAKNLAGLSFAKWKKSDFADLAYFEPAYLKEVYTTTPRSQIN